MKTLQIITPCSRPQNLQKIKENIEQVIKVSYDWYVVFDRNTDPIEISSDDIKIYKNHDTPSQFGNMERNYALNYKDNYEFVYFLDDDNLIHEDFMGLFNYIDPTTDIYVFNQDYRMLSGTHKGCTEGNIDTACFLMRSKIIGDVRWHPSDYGADGRFIGDLQANNVVKFIPVFFARYNMLRK
jgi:hypothetical protein